MRTPLRVVTSLAMVLGAACPAVEPVAPERLDQRPSGDGPQHVGERPPAPDAAARSAEPGGRPKVEPGKARVVRPRGTLARPAGATKHADLDRAWDAYEAAVVKFSESLAAAIGRQFDASAARGDLDAADTWQAAARVYGSEGVIPADLEIRGGLAAADAAVRRAREDLARTYESLTRALTIEKRIEDAKKVREEWQVVTRAATTPGADAAAPPDPFAGRWRWIVGSTRHHDHEFLPDGTIRGVGGAAWSCTDQTGRRYEVRWGPKTKDVVVMTADGRVLRGTTGGGESIVAVKRP